MAIVRKAAAEFARAVDAPGRPTDGPPSPVGADVLRAATVAHRVRAAAPALTPTPDVDFRAALRTRLVAVASVQAATAETSEKSRASEVSTAVPARTSRSAERRWARAGGVAAGAMASVVAVTGVAVASQASLPGDPFYGLKRTTEDVQLRLADGPQEQGRQHLDFASERLDEVRGLLLGRDALTGAAGATSGSGSTDSERMLAGMSDMDDDTTRGAALLDEAFDATGDRAVLEELAGFADRQGAELRELIAALPGDTTARAEQSLALLAGVTAQTEALLVQGPPTTPLTAPLPLGPTPDTTAPNTTAPTTSAPSTNAPATQAPGGTPTLGPARTPTPAGPTVPTGPKVPTVPSLPGAPTLPQLPGAKGPKPTTSLVPLPGSLPTGGPVVPGIDPPLPN